MFNVTRVESMAQKLVNKAKKIKTTHTLNTSFQTIFVFVEVILSNEKSTRYEDKSISNLPIPYN